MTATERAAALELARSVIEKYGADADKPSVKLALGLLAAEAERERLAVCRRLLDMLSYEINASINGDSDEGPSHWKVSRADFPELFAPNRAGEAMWIFNAIQAALDITATTDTERHDG